MPQTFTAPIADLSDPHSNHYAPTCVPDPEVYADLASLATMMPGEFREIFTARWLDETRRPMAEIGTSVGRSAGVVRNRLDMCLWNCHRLAQHHQLPAIARLLGPDRREWPARAWAQAARWDDLASRMAETRLLLAIGGMDVPQIQQIIGQHLIKIGVLSTNPWGSPLTRRDRAALAQPAVDRIVEHTLWPDTPAAPWTPEAFTAKRAFTGNWLGITGRGYFQSQKLGRMVMYESLLEREMLRHLDADHRVTEILEQPFTLPVFYEGKEHRYTPDVIVRLTDGRVIVIEVKGPVRLGQFEQWMRWHALLRHCEHNGYGTYIGNNKTGSIIDHHTASHTSPYRELVRKLADQGAPVRSDNRLALQAEDQILIAQAITAEMLAWKPGPKGGISRPIGTDLDRARAFWNRVAAGA